MAINQKTIKQINTHIYALDLKKIHRAYECQQESVSQQDRFRFLN
jgi:hypothetical protein